MSSEDNLVRAMSRRITLEELYEYADTPARVAEDIITPNGATILPRGTSLASLSSSLKVLERNLRQCDILSIPIVISNTLDMSMLENLMKAVEKNVTNVDSQLVRETITQVENVFGRISEGISGPEDVSQLTAQGKTIAKEVAQAPQVMLCLGKVRSWDEYTYVHSLNVALLSGFLASRIYPNQPEIAESVTIGGIMHDLGKALVPKEVLNKPGKLTDDEFTIMKKHTVYGEELAIANGVSDPITLSVIRGHHERYGGHGYPDAFEKDQIRMEARIAAVSDVFDALTARRVYKEPMESRAAVSIMMENMTDHFDPSVVRALLVSIGLFPPGTGVELSDGSLGVVVGAKGNDLMRPEVMLHVDKMGRKVEGMNVVDLSLSDLLFVRRSMQDVGKIAF